MTFSGLGKLLSIAGGFRRVPENVAPPSGRLLSEVLGGEVEPGANREQTQSRGPFHTYCRSIPRSDLDL